MKFKYLPVLALVLLAFSVAVFSQKLFFDNTFAPNINGTVKFVEVTGGKILISGNFTTVNGTARHKIARLNSDGTLDETFDANSAIPLSDNPVVYSMEVLPDGKILLGGDFGATEPAGYRKVVMRLNADGTFDNTLTSIPRILGGSLYGYAIRLEKAEQLASGKIMICGIFREANGNQQPRLARYNSDGSYDSTFTNIIFPETPSSYCRDVEAQPDGKYFVSGFYSTINGASSPGLRRFNADDSVDTSFVNASVGNHSGIKLFGDGKLIAGQAGNDFASQAAYFNSDGSIIRLYDANMSSTSDYLRSVADASFQANGKVFIVDNSRPLLYRYNVDGTRDASLNRLWFHANDFPNGGVRAVSVLPDGKVLVGGNFDYLHTELSDPATRKDQKFLARFTPQSIPIKRRYDFDGDGKDDVALFRPSNRVWYLNQSSAGFYATQFGLSQDIPVVEDYDGDGKADIAVFRPSEGVWYWLRSSDSVFAYTVHGQAGDIPLPGKYSFFGSTGVVTFRPSEAKFIVQRPFFAPSHVTMRNFTMLATDTPLLADFNGDGANDIGVFRDGHWFIDDGTSPDSKHYQFGLPGDKPLIGDFDADGRTDYAVFRPSNGVWYLQKTTEGFAAVRWGLSDDLPIPADYDGDGRTDIAVYRPSEGMWYQLLSSNGSYRFDRFGLAEDIPAQLR